MDFKSEDYLEYISELPCIITGSPRADCHHESVLRRFSGGQKRKFDFGALPLEHFIHIEERHGWGKNKFWQHYDMNPVDICVALITVYIERGGKDIDKAEEALRMLIDEHYP